MRMRLALALPAFMLLSGCDLDGLLGVKKPYEAPGAKELAGSWDCTSVGGSRRPADTTYASSLAFLRDGTATEVSTMRGPIKGKPAEMQGMERMTWERKADRISFKTTSHVVTAYTIDGRRQDLGEANKLVVYRMQQRPDELRVVARVVELTSNQLALDADDGGRITCRRKV